uniref:SEC7 domain-containing protein n=1 Tax=Romanomermis culicivorax TaxID=13658 RepID=A0A915KF72_ROMCU
MSINGVYVVQGELNAIMGQLRRSITSNNQKWQVSELEVLLRSFVDLREVLNTFSDLSDMSPSTYLGPFLEVVRSEHTFGPVTGQALAAVNKFLSYGLVNPHNLTAPNAVQSIADSVNHTRFIGTDTGSDEVVLFRILQVLRSLLLTPVGNLLTDESVCELLQSCVRICFEKRLSELLRKSAECCLMDMVQLLFARLPTFVEDPRHPYVRRLKMRRKKQKTSVSDENGVNVETPQQNEDNNEITNTISESTTNITNELINERGVKFEASRVVAEGDEEDEPENDEDTAPKLRRENENETENGDETSLAKVQNSNSVDEQAEKAPYGLPSVRELLRFLISISNPNEKQNSEDMLELGLNLLIVAFEAGADYLGKLVRADRASKSAAGRFTILLPLIKNELCKNLNANLLNFASNISSNANLTGKSSSIFALTLRLGFLCFEALRTHLKFQLESYLVRLKELVLADQQMQHNLTAGGAIPTSPLVGHHSGTLVGHGIKVAGPAALAAILERRELALEALVELWRIPGLVTELYLNYDCDLYCSNLFEELTKLLSKNSFPIGQELTSAHLLSLDALLTVVDSIETNCHYRMLNNYNESQDATSSLDKRNLAKNRAAAASASTIKNPSSPSHMLPLASGISAGQISISQASSNAEETKSSDDSAEIYEVLRLPQLRPNRMPISADQIFSHEDLIARKQKKRLLQTGTDLFNQSPAKGVAYLQEHGLFRTPLETKDVVDWLKENPHLDKRKIAEYIVNRKNSHILKAFVQSFDFRNVRLDQALRPFLETFRLPGEAAEISMVMEHFSEHWHDSNKKPFRSVDAAFTLSYAVIMLNTDQHNALAKRQNQPMTCEAFKKNLNGVNGGQNFDHQMLEEMYRAVSHNEIIMPAEQTGLVRENYMWKLLLKRGQKPEGTFIHAPSGLYDHDLFQLVWGPTVAAMSYVYDKTSNELITAKVATGFRKCAAVAAHYVMSDVFDNLIINLCKFSQILNFPDQPQSLTQELAENNKAQCASKTMFQLIRNHGDILREGWNNVCECFLQLFKADLLPESLTMVEDFVENDGMVNISKQIKWAKRRRNDPNNGGSGGGGLFSSFYNYLGGTSSQSLTNLHSDSPTPQEQVARDLIQECKPDQLIVESKYLTSEALAEFLKALVVCGAQAAQTRLGPRSSTAAAAAVPHSRQSTINANVQQHGLQSSSHRSAAMDDDQIGEWSIVFYLEILVSVCLENRDRLTPFWRTIRAHIFSIISDYTACESLVENSRFVVERAVVAWLRLVARLLTRIHHDETLRDELIATLAALPSSLPKSTFCSLSRQIAGGVGEILRATAAASTQQTAADDATMNREQWAVFVELLEAVGANVFTTFQPIVQEEIRQKHRKPTVAKSDNEESRQTSDQDQESLDRGYTSDTELYSSQMQQQQQNLNVQKSMARDSRASSNEWLYVVGGGTATTTSNVPTGGDAIEVENSATIVTEQSRQKSRPRVQDPAAFLKCCDTLAFLIRDAADHVTLENIELLIRCLKTFVDASVGVGALRDSPSTNDATSSRSSKKSREKKRSTLNEESTDAAAAASGSTNATSNDERKAVHDSLEEAALLLVDLCHVLHTKAARVFGLAEQNPTPDEAEKITYVWVTCWRSVLQILCQTCCDKRRKVRLYALTSLQRALLMHDLRRLSPLEWQDCFYHVLFPLVTSLLDEKNAPQQPSTANASRKSTRQQPSEVVTNVVVAVGLDEARVRAVTLTSKAFLQHLGPLSTCPTFGQLWLTLLDFMQRFLALDSPDLNESVPESVKNMLLVVRTANLFSNDGQLAEMTRQKLAHFLPDLTEMTNEEQKSHLENDEQKSGESTEKEVSVEGIQRTENSVEQNTIVAESDILEEIVVDRSMSPTFLTSTAKLESSPSISLLSSIPQSTIVLHPPVVDRSQEMAGGTEACP